MYNIIIGGEEMAKKKKKKQQNKNVDKALGTLAIILTIINTLLLILNNIFSIIEKLSK